MADKPSKKKTSPLGQGLASLLGDTNLQPVTRPKDEVSKSASPNAVANLKQQLETKKNKRPKAQVDEATFETPNYLAIDQLEPGKFQPRRQFPAEALKELAQSIETQGVLQPIIVRNRSAEGQKPDYEIVAGERRWRAAQLASLHEVPVIIREFDDRTTLELSILENVQRQDLTALEEAEGYARLIDEFGHRQEDLAKIMGKSRPHIANTLRLLSMPEKIRVALELGSISAGHARAISTAQDPDALLEQVVKNKLSVREAEKLAKKPNANQQISSASSKASKDVDTLALEKSLEERLGLKVEINGKGEKGTLSIRYKTLEQLDQILARLR